MVKKSNQPTSVATKKSTKNSSNELIEGMRRYLKKHGERILAQYPNSTSVGIGYKSTKGKRIELVALQFTVDRKLSPESLVAESLGLIPEVIKFEGMQLITDVLARKFRPSYIVVENVPQKADGKCRMNPVQPGASIANIKSTAGTLGAIVQDATSGTPVLLSNWHVLNGSNGQVGDQVSQPGSWDDNRVEENIIGKLLRSHLGIAGDCAICSISGRSFNPIPLGLKTQIKQIGHAELGDTVVKSGRTTGVTWGKVVRVNVLTKMPYDGFDEPVTISGFEIEPHPEHPAVDNEISRPGDSGSVWFAVDKKGNVTDIMLGLHFGGDADHTTSEVALACNAKSVFEKLEIAPLSTPASALQAQRMRGTEELQNGFDVDFLEFKVPYPTFIKTVRIDLASVLGNINIDYTHFSVWLSMSRKLPLCVAWNINGDLKKSLPRKGIPFVKDLRGDLEQYQWGDELYKNNALDKGHVARRDDLVWGETEAEASQANQDSFYFTNMTPQHAAFNQSKLKGLWGLLENAILDEVTLSKLRVSLMGGPILAADDPEYRNAQIPREFWKVVLFTDASTNTSKVRAFILTQTDLVGNLAPESLELEEFRWYQVPLEEIQKKTGITFDNALHQLSALQPQGLEKSPKPAPIRPIGSDFKGAFD
jgi:endonuclease G